MIKYNNLDRMRQPAAPVITCPKCGETVTVEDTDFFHIEICEHCLDYSKIESVGECCRNPKHHYVRMLTAAGTVQIKKQCENCGKAGGPALGGFTQEQKQSMPLLNQEARDNNEKLRSDITRSYYEKISRLRTVQFNRKREVEKNNWFSQYQKYLQSPEWKEKRLQVLKRDNYLCQACLDAFATQRTLF